MDPSYKIVLEVEQAQVLLPVDDGAHSQLLSGREVRSVRPLHRKLDAGFDCPKLASTLQSVHSSTRWDGDNSEYV